MAVRIKFQKVIITVQALLLLAAPVLIYGPISAATLDERSVSISTSVPEADASHRYRFEIVSATLLGSIKFEYCSNSPLFEAPCTAPDGLILSSGVLSSQNGETGFSIHPDTTDNVLVLTRVPLVALPQMSTYEVDDITNPGDTETSFYIRISTYASDDGTGAMTDNGAVVFSTSGGFSTSGFVPPFLTFCVGITVHDSCLSTSGSLINLGVLKHNETKFATSQFAAATNDVAGYVTYLLGTTLTSGNNIIPGLSTPTGSAEGESQFGINLRDNNSPDVGTDISGIGTGTPDADYDNPNSFTFIPGDAVARATTGTDFNKYTVSYIVNISKSQAPGTYSTTMTYMAVASF